RSCWALFVVHIFFFVSAMPLFLFLFLHDALPILRQVVRLMQAELPSTGFCARYGGEEFVLVLPDMSAAAAVGIVERVRRRVAAQDRKSTRLNSSHVKISYAVFCLNKNRLVTMDSL